MVNICIIFFLFQVSQNSDSVVDGTPDLYTFVLTGLREIQEEYGLDSSQAEDAAKVMNEFLSKVGLRYCS